jgi:hypothetical protein
MKRRRLVARSTIGVMTVLLPGYLFCHVSYRASAAMETGAIAKLAPKLPSFVVDIREPSPCQMANRQSHSSASAKPALREIDPKGLASLWAGERPLRCACARFVSTQSTRLGFDSSKPITVTSNRVQRSF